MLHEDFEYLDFIVVEAPEIDVLRVMATYRADMGVPDMGATPAFPGAGDPDKKPGMIGLMWWALKQWIFSPKDPPEDSGDDLFLHTDTAAELDRMIIWGNDNDGVTVPVETRVSGLLSSPDWTLVEFADLISGMSMTAMHLSTQMPEEDVFFFRRSGRRTNQPQFDFHHYRAGEQRRRVMSHCTVPTEGDPWWEGYAEGPMLPFEDPEAYKTSDQATLLTADKQADILARMGVPLGALFDPDMRESAVLISDKPGGAPLSVLD